MRAEAHGTLLLLYPILFFAFPLLLLLLLVQPLLLKLNLVLHEFSECLLCFVKGIKAEIVVGLDIVRALLLLLLNVAQRRVTILFYIFAVFLILMCL